MCPVHATVADKPIENDLLWYNTIQMGLELLNTEEK
jgi:hypothetical protein